MSKRIEDEKRRIDRIKSAAQPPVQASPEIIAAPGAGARQVHRPVELVHTKDGPKLRPMTQMGFHPVRTSDMFTLTEAASKRAKPNARPIFTARQVNAGLTYAEICELITRGSSPRSCLNMDVGGGDGVGFNEAVIHLRRRVADIERAVGGDVVLQPVRRSAGDARRIIRARPVVDLFCLSNMPIDRILMRYRWPLNGRNRKHVLDGLCSALERIADTLDQKTR